MILLNKKGYGALGAAAFRWYDETIAEGITDLVRRILADSSAVASVNELH